MVAEMLGFMLIIGIPTACIGIFTFLHNRGII